MLSLFVYVYMFVFILKESSILFAWLLMIYPFGTLWLVSFFLFINFRLQNEVRITLNVEKSSLSLVHVILRYINPGTAVVSGQITAYQSRPQKGR